MNTLLGSLSRSAFRNVPLTVRHPLRVAHPALLNSTLLHARNVASSVSVRPGSQTLEHAATNIKEELGNSAADVAKVIAGANMTNDSVAPTNTTFVSSFRVWRRGLFIYAPLQLVAWDH